MTTRRKEKKKAFVIWSIPFIIIGVGFFIWTILGVILFIEKTAEALQYSKNCIVIEGEVSTVSQQWIEESGKYGSSYWGYKGDIVYTDENGEMAVFKVDEYVKELAVGQKIKLIYQPDAPQDVDRAVYHVLLSRYVPAHLYINPLAIFSILFVGGLGGYGFLWLGKECLWDDTNKPKESRRDKLYRLEQNIALSKVGFILATIIAGGIFVSYIGLFNPFKACWTEAVVEGMELHRVSESSGDFTEYYRYECSVVTQEGETVTGYIIEESGKWETKDRLEVLWYEGIDLEKRLNTPESLLENLIPILFPLGTALLWGYYEIQYKIALKEE